MDSFIVYLNFLLEFAGLEELVDYVNTRSHSIPSAYSGRMNSEVIQFLLGSSYPVTKNQNSALFVSNFCAPFATPLNFSCDIDSYAYVGTNIPVLRTLGLVLRPVYTKSYRHNTGVIWSSKKYTNNIATGVHTIPNIHFLDSQDISVSFFIFSRLFNIH